MPFEILPADRQDIEEIDIGDKTLVTHTIIAHLLHTVTNPFSPLEQMLLNSTANIIFDFRSKALTSYDKDEFTEIPELLRRFIDRDYIMTPGREIEYHKGRIDYLNFLFKDVDDNPKHLKDAEKFLLTFFQKYVKPSQSPRTKSNAWLQFRQLEANIADLYAMLSIKRFGYDRYISGIDENGRLYTKGARKHGLDETVAYFAQIHSHAMTFLTFDPKPFQGVIPDNAMWATDPTRTSVYENDMNGAIGFDMLQVGQDNKHFYSSLPHEVIIKDGHIKTITVKDVPPKEICFSVRYADDTISAGNMSSQYPEFHYFANLSDLHAEVINNNYCKTNTFYILFDLAGSIARDMFVCENKNKYYEISGVRAKSKKVREKKNLRERVIWLPRFKVNLVDRRTETDYLIEQVISLSPCHVSGHPRRSISASEKQLRLAKELGIQLPPGFTYVREHDRAGSGEFRRLYKSRSAVNLIYRRKI